MSPPSDLGGNDEQASQLGVSRKIPRQMKPGSGPAFGPLGSCVQTLPSYLSTL